MIVRSPPAIIGGAKLKTAFRAGPEPAGISIARAFLSIDQPAIRSEMSPSAIQTASQALKLVGRAAIAVASRAVQPMAISPQPEMPVKAVARSIVSRM